MQGPLRVAAIAAVLGGAAVAANSQAMALPATGTFPAGVEKVCAITFDKDTRRPARVQDNALSCIEEAAKRLKAEPNRKLVLVGTADLEKDYEADENGKMRETEDTTGYDVRLEDLAAYRALNTKWYIVHFYRIDPSRIQPTTDEWTPGQTVTLYLVPGDADFNHNYLGTTKTNEKPCTVKPCYTADEETLTAQPRSRIPAPSKAAHKTAQ
jgi:hypothetical protein